MSTSVQVDLGKMSREDVIEIAKKQNVQIKEKNAKIQDLTKALAEAQQHIPLAQLVNEKDEAIRTLKDSLHDKIAQLEQLEQKTATWKQRVMELSTQDQKRIEELTAAAKSSEITITQLRVALQDAQCRLDASVSSITQLQAQHTTEKQELTSKLATQVAQYDALKASAIARFQAMNTTIEDLKNKQNAPHSDQSAAEIMQLTHTLNQTREYIAELEAALAASRASATERERALSDRVAELESELATAESSGEREGALGSRVAELEAALAASRASATERERALSDRAAELESELATANAVAECSVGTKVPENDVAMGYVEEGKPMVVVCGGCVELRKKLAEYELRQSRWKAQVRAIVESEGTKVKFLENVVSVLEEMIVQLRMELCGSRLSETQAKYALECCQSKLAVLSRELSVCQHELKQYRTFHGEVISMFSRGKTD